MRIDATIGEEKREIPFKIDRVLANRKERWFIDLDPYNDLGADYIGFYDTREEAEKALATLKVEVVE